MDYLLTPEFGGSTTIRNLWPESYHAPVGNAHMKDELEDRLRRSGYREGLDRGS